MEDYEAYLCPIIAKRASEQERFKKLFPEIAIHLGFGAPEKDIPANELPPTPPTQVLLPPRKRIYRRVGFLLAILIGLIAYFSYQLLFPPQRGCTDPAALNYNPKATINTGNCIYAQPDKKIIGCMDRLASNFNVGAENPCNNCCEYISEDTLRTKAPLKVQTETTHFLVQFKPEALSLPSLMDVSQTTGYKIYRYKNLITWVLLAALLGLLLSGLLYRRAKRAFIATKERGIAPPYQLSIGNANPPQTNLFLNHPQIFNQFRNIEPGPRQIIDVPATIRASAKMAGLLDFRYSFSTKTSSYLLLIDLNHPQNHHAQLAEHFFQGLVDHEIFVHRYFFDGTLDFCWNDQHAQGIPFDQIVQTHYEDQLIILGNGYSFIHGSSNELAPITRSIAHWKNRLLITPTHPGLWDYKETILNTFFTIIPNSAHGISRIGDLLDSPTIYTIEDWKNGYTASLPQAHSIEHGFMENLKQFFSTPLLKWIAGCAIYPELHWDLTLAIGHKLLGSSSVSYENLWSISQIDWFRVGKIPNTFRAQLLEFLAPEEQQLVRQAILEVLRANDPAIKNSHAFEEYQMHIAINELLAHPTPNRRVKWTEQYNEQIIKGIPGDFIGIHALNDRYNRLFNFKLPQTLLKAVYQNGQRIQGIRYWVPFFWGGLAAILILFANHLFRVACYEDSNLVSIPTEPAKYCLTNLEDSLIYHTKLGHYLIDLNKKDSVLKFNEYYQDLRRTMPSQSARINETYFYTIAKSAYNKALEFYEKRQFENALAILNELYFTPNNQAIAQIQNASFNGQALHLWGINQFYAGHLELARATATLIEEKPTYVLQLPVPNLFQMLAYDFVDSIYYGRIRVRQNDQYDFLTPRGEPLWDEPYGLRFGYAYNFRKDTIDTSPIALTHNFEGIQCFVDPNGQVILNSCFEQLAPFQCSSGNWGYQNENNVTVISCQFDEAGTFDPIFGLARVKKDGKYGFIEKNGVVKIPLIYEDAFDFVEQLANVRMGDKWGYINPRGETVIPFRFDATGNFENGVATVELGINRFRIDQSGHCIDGNQCPLEPFSIRVLDSQTQQPIANAVLNHPTLGNFTTDNTGQATISILEHLLPMRPRFFISADDYYQREIELILEPGIGTLSVELEQLNLASIDLDNDGIPNLEDHCPDQPGTAQFNGCPDSDGDKIPDPIDSCPDNPGNITNNGCPTGIAISDQDFNWLNGNWFGSSTEKQFVKTSAWTIELSIDLSNKQFNSYYPALPCRSEWIPRSISNQAIIFQEKIFEYPDRCPNNRMITLEQINDTRIKLTFRNPGEEAILLEMTLKRVNRQKEATVEKAGIYYPIFTAQGKQWLGHNLAVIVPYSDCYAINSQNCKDFGRLYNIAGAEKSLQ